ncbi:transposase [Intestinimonas massiliensis (ex Afouda et al. 2020)]|uniref:transposase n=1 Tax=Intestinimonas massiliensis (ex Afouda et al. 2020) TaxID=1673721 RepID=UPI0010314C7B|nr:transposase [Intestinimonas massiliensis (ex Afouda et al. 2020)]
MAGTDRRPLRLKGYDYAAAGYYFVTVCTKNRALYLRRGAHCAPEPLPPLTAAGIAAERALLAIPAHYPGVAVDKYVVMPNHVHMILTLPAHNGRALRAPTVSRIVRGWKEAVTKALGTPVWQKSFYDHIIRDENDYLRIWTYLETNPAKWAEDKYYIAQES